MKKLLMASTILFMFSTSILLFQISFSKDANATNNIINGTASKIIFAYDTDNFAKTVSKSVGTVGQITIQLPNGYKDYSNIKSLQTDRTNIYCSAIKSTGTGANHILFKTDMNGGSLAFIATYKDIDQVLIY